MRLPEDEFVIVSSGSLAVRGIRDARDLDICVSDKLWGELVKKYPVKKKGGIEVIDTGEKDIEILGKGSVFRDSSIASVAKIISTADLIGGIRYINLELLTMFKQKMGREKDIKDIQLINGYLALQD